VSNPSQNMQLQIAAATWRIETKSDSALYQITFGGWRLTRLSSLL